MILNMTHNTGIDCFVYNTYLQISHVFMFCNAAYDCLYGNVSAGRAKGRIWLVDHSISKPSHTK